VLGHQGTREPRCSDNKAPGSRGARAPRHQGAEVLGHRGTRERRCSGTKAPGSPGARAPRHQGAQVLGHQGTRVPRCSGTKAPGCRGARAPGLRGAEVLGCLGSKVPRCSGAKGLGADVLGQQASGVPRCSGAWDPGCRGARTPRHQGAEVPGRQGAGCRGSRGSGFRGAEVLSDIDHLGHWAPRCSVTKAPGCQGARDIVTTDIGHRAFSWGIEGGARAKSARGVSKDAPKASHRLPSSLQNFRFFRVPHPPYSALIAVLPPTPTDTCPLEAGYTKLKLLFLEF